MRERSSAGTQLTAAEGPQAADIERSPSRGSCSATLTSADDPGNGLGGVDLLGS